MSSHLPILDNSSHAVHLSDPSNSHSPPIHPIASAAAADLTGNSSERLSEAGKLESRGGGIITGASSSTLLQQHNNISNSSHLPLQIQPAASSAVTSAGVAGSVSVLGKHALEFPQSQPADRLDDPLDDESPSDELPGGVSSVHKSLIECGNVDNIGIRQFYENSVYFGKQVEIYTAVSDATRRILYRASMLAEKFNCATNKVGMYLARRRNNETGLFQAVGFKDKPTGRTGLKTGGYFLSLEVCRSFEAHFVKQNSRKKMKREPNILANWMQMAALHQSLASGLANSGLSPEQVVLAFQQLLPSSTGSAASPTNQQQSPQQQQQQQQSLPSLISNLAMPAHQPNAGGSFTNSLPPSNPTQNSLHSNQNPALNNSNPLSIGSLLNFSNSATQSNSGQQNQNAATAAAGQLNPNGLSPVQLTQLQALTNQINALNAQLSQQQQAEAQLVHHQMQSQQLAAANFSGISPFSSPNAGTPHFLAPRAIGSHTNSSDSSLLSSSTSSNNYSSLSGNSGNSAPQFPFINFAGSPTQPVPNSLATSPPSSNSLMSGFFSSPAVKLGSQVSYPFTNDKSINDFPPLSPLNNNSTLTAITPHMSNNGINPTLSPFASPNPLSRSMVAHPQSYSHPHNSSQFFSMTPQMPFRPGFQNSVPNNFQLTSHQNNISIAQANLLAAAKK